LQHPRKSKELIPVVADLLNLPIDCIAAVSGFYWQEVRKSLSALKHQRVHVTNLGDFTIKHWNIDARIEQLQKWEEMNKTKGLQEIRARFKIAESIYDLKNIKKQVEEEKQRASFIKLHKKLKHESFTTEHIKDLEE
jgi:exonuclease III